MWAETKGAEAKEFFDRLLIHCDWRWLILIESDWCRLMLIDADWSSKIKVPPWIILLPKSMISKHDVLWEVRRAKIRAFNIPRSAVTTSRYTCQAGQVSCLLYRNISKQKFTFILLEQGELDWNNLCARESLHKSVSGKKALVGGAACLYRAAQSGKEPEALKVPSVSRRSTIEPNRSRGKILLLQNTRFIIF